MTGRRHLPGPADAGRPVGTRCLAQPRFRHGAGHSRSVIQQGITAVDVDVEGSRLIAGIGNMGDVISRAVPPDMSRPGPISNYMLES